MGLKVEYKPPTPGLLGALRAAEHVAVHEAADHLKTVAVDRTPKLSGRLRDSAQVTDLGPLPESAVSFGQDDGNPAKKVSNTSAYAVRQHEEEDYHHPVGEAGWLKKSMHSEAEAMLGIEGEHLRPLFGA